MSPRLCSRCHKESFPDRWCECDPREQLHEFWSEACVYLMAEEGVPPDDTLDQAFAEALLR